MRYGGNVDFIYDTPVEIGAIKTVKAYEKVHDEKLFEMYIKSQTKLSFEEWKKALNKNNNKTTNSTSGGSNVKGADLAQM